MSEELLARCGYRCDLCLAYAPNTAKADRREELSRGWAKIYGLTIPPEHISCEGCLGPGSPKLIDTGCPVRPCVLERHLANCSQCGEYPCDTFRKRQVIGEEVIRGKDVSAEERELFVRPYENRQRLNALRAQRRPS